MAVAMPEALLEKVPPRPAMSEAFIGSPGNSAENTMALVQGIQTKVTARETEVGNKLSALKDELTAAVSAGRLGG